MMNKRNLTLVVVMGLLTLTGCKDRVIWNDNGKVENATENREVWDSNGQMNTGDRKVWVDKDGNELSSNNFLSSLQQYKRSGVWR